MKRKWMVRIFAILASLFMLVSMLRVNVSEDAVIEREDNSSNQLIIGETKQLKVIEKNFAEDDVVHWSL